MPEIELKFSTELRGAFISHPSYFAAGSLPQLGKVASKYGKKALIVPKATHVDLYDQVDIILWDKLTSFFTEHLK